MFSRGFVLLTVLAISTTTQVARATYLQILIFREQPEEPLHLELTRWASTPLARSPDGLPIVPATTASYFLAALQQFST